jgi:hypothetical protein
MASIKYRVIAALSGKRAVQHPMLTSDHMAEILAEHKALLAKIEDAARNGSVADALALSLHANHGEQLGEWRRLFTDEQLSFEACLRRLDVMFPAPLPPAPEPPAPPPPQYFPRLGRLLSEDRVVRPH